MENAIGALCCTISKVQYVELGLAFLSEIVNEQSLPTAHIAYRNGIKEALGTLDNLLHCAPPTARKSYPSSLIAAIFSCIYADLQLFP